MYVVEGEDEVGIGIVAAEIEIVVVVVVVAAVVAAAAVVSVAVGSLVPISSAVVGVAGQGCPSWVCSKSLPENGTSVVRRTAEILL